MAKRGRPKKKVTTEVAKKAPEVKDERGKLIKKILADPRLPTEKAYIAGGRDVLRNAYELQQDYGSEMAKFGVGFTGLMKQKE